MSKSWLERLASPRLTIRLLLALAVVAAIGTFELIPQGLDQVRYIERYGLLGRIATSLGLDHFHTSLPFRALFLLLLANLMACGVGRSVESFKNALGRGAPALSLPLADREGAIRKLTAAGYKVGGSTAISAKKRIWAFAAFGLVHLTPFIIAAGAFWGTEAGFLGTANLHVGAIESKFMDWKNYSEVELPFAVEVRSVRRFWYPLRVRLTARTPEGAQSGELEVVTGEKLPVPNTPFSLVVDSFDPDAQDISYRVFSQTEVFGPFTRKEMAKAPLRLSPLAYKGNVKRVEASLSVYDPSSRELGKGVVAVNEPLVFDDYRIFLTNWGQDEQDKPFVGLQIARDPGQPLVWFGSLLLSCGLMLLLFVDGAWVAERDGQLIGRSIRNRRKFAELLKGAAGGDS